MQNDLKCSLENSIHINKHTADVIIARLVQRNENLLVLLQFLLGCAGQAEYPREPESVENMIMSSIK